MSQFQVHTQETAPAAADTLAQVEKGYGFLPNLIGVMAEAPALAEAYVAVAGAFGKSSLSATEQQTVLLAASTVNGCTYCVAAHTTVGQMTKVPADVLESLRAGEALADPKLEALRRLTVAVVESRGWPSQELVQGFFDAGYGRQQLLEVVLGVGLKTLSNYTNHLADTPLDAAFAANAWQRSEAAA
ncbi:MAG: carboxymuconolactone decarboxylase family protein [Acidobacteriota bacterium]